MSYHTKYELCTDPPYLVGLQDVASALAATVDGVPASDPAHRSKAKAWEDILNGYERVAWHNHEHDLAKATAHWKNIIFDLHGRGEDEEDVWTLYCMNGKTHKAHWQMTCESFDQTKLSEPSPVPA